MTNTAPSANATAARRATLGTPPKSGLISQRDIKPTSRLEYSDARILATWAAAALPMAALAWVLAPWLAGVFEGPGAWPRASCSASPWAWLAVRPRAPARPPRARLAALVGAQERVVAASPRKSSNRSTRRPPVAPPSSRWCSVAAKEQLPKLPSPFDRDQGSFLQSVAGHEFFSGNWPWFAVIVTMMIFNTVLGEELLFRGLLLPRMRGAFGRWDWLANGVLFGIYHLHVPWTIPQNLLDTFILSYPTRRYRSALIGIAVHSVQTVVFTALLLALVLIERRRYKGPVPNLSGPTRAPWVRRYAST